MTEEDDAEWSGLREIELLQLLKRVLPSLIGQGEVLPEVKLGREMRPDFVVRRDNTPDAIIELKGLTPSTRRRLDEVGDQLGRYGLAYRQRYPNRPEPELVLAVGGTLSTENIKYLRERGVSRVISGPEIRAATLSNNDHSIPTEIHSGLDPADRAAIEELHARLQHLAPGKQNWSLYQTTCRDLLAYLLAPPLNYPISESSNESGVNRRDMIFPNYALEGFWSYMRETYAAHFIVADAKNYTGKVKKKDVLQLANYLSPHGTGKFGFIVTRDSADNGAEVTRREQWFMHGKMIVLLNDADLGQMVAMKLAARDSAEHIRQKVEDFRLAF